MRVPVTNRRPSSPKRSAHPSLTEKKTVQLVEGKSTGNMDDPDRRTLHENTASLAEDVAASSPGDNGQNEAIPDGQGADEPDETTDQPQQQQQCLSLKRLTNL